MGSLWAHTGAIGCIVLRPARHLSQVGAIWHSMYIWHRANSNYTLLARKHLHVRTHVCAPGIHQTHNVKQDRNTMKSSGCKNLPMSHKEGELDDRDSCTGDGNDIRVPVWRG